MNWKTEPGRIFREENGKLLAEIRFPEILPGICDICHTFVDESLRGQGIAGELAQMAVNQILSEGKKAKASCSFVVKWLERHPQEAAKLCWQPEELHAQLRKMGFLPSDTVMVHSSLRAIGPVAGGAMGLIDALRTYFSKGLLLIPTHTWANVNPEHPDYDASSTEPCIGTLPRIAAFHPDGVRSLHPTHSVAAFGERAAEYVKGEELFHTPAPPEGCWGRLYQENAKILLAGVSQNRNTYLHAVEEMIGVPDRLGAEPYLIHGRNGRGFCWENPMHPHRCSRSGDVSQFYPRYLPAFEKYGAVRIGQFGSARAEICSARKCAAVLREIWKRAEGEIGVGEEPLAPELYDNLNIQEESTVKEILSTPDAPAAIGPYSQAVKAGGLIFVSGQLPINPQSGEMPEGIREQARQSLENLKAILAAAGCTMENAVKTTVLLEDIEDFAAVNEVYAEYFSKDCPARACYAVDKLPKGAKVEIELIACQE